jgi:magnesium chelatase subunit D
MLVDTSASMAGYRLQSAKFLAEHLILSTRSKVSVIAFQEKKAEVFVPFTRSHSQLRNGLRSMNSFGLTPLAYGIYYSIKRIKSEKIKDPLLLLITDGIPTVPYWGSDPIVDAIKASELIAGEKLHFCCIGLQPNKKCLSKMIERSGGNLYIVDELDKNVLASIAHKEITTHIK